ncbi:hypothetical protein [Streptomyces sp. 1331.2]|uniref:hypothetical protein n=1 Tax=Streptomyces sp. 1331.2 TaxID=1938835 RepID=UPI000BC4226A|nr:hypothetical protein [Streptomyces sp. 1331.2]SOB88671.1 hypothetical protein SAMN06272789_6961 [Streptomyces sp. 1331.2]
MSMMVAGKSNFDNVKHLTLDQFLNEAGPEGFQELVGRISGGSFSECHIVIAQETGIFIDELVPIFQKLDALLVTRPLPSALQPA